jgi:Type II site-specific deoxyribonuclease
MTKDPGSDKRERLQRLTGMLPRLTPGQLLWLEKVVGIFGLPADFKNFTSSLLDSESLQDFGDALRIHHAFSKEPFSKDKFEYVLEQVLKSKGIEAQLAAKGNRGHDLTISGERFSLKTQADSNIKLDEIWISKFMELGKGAWGRNPKDLKGLRDAFLEHLTHYERILTLRALSKSPDWKYELVEIPKSLLEEAVGGELKMMKDSKQLPRPGYCYVRDSRTREMKFQLYFDGGGERKLQVKSVLKKLCTVHACWQFSIPEA